MVLLFSVFSLSPFCMQDRDSQKMEWINRFVQELKNDKWVLPALKQIREICQLFTEVTIQTYCFKLKHLCG